MEAWREELYHIGVPKKSGRFPWGSGKNPYHHTGLKLRARGLLTDKRKKEGYYLEDKSVSKSFSSSKTESDAKTDSKKDKSSNSNKEALKASSKMAKSISEVAKKSADKERSRIKDSIDLSSMSNDDLKRYITRYNLEKSYKDIKASEIKVGKDRVAEVMNTLGDTLSVASSAVELVSAIQGLKNKD